jgi:uncharacterized membrane protein YkvA (DUF1232 family)
MTSGALTRLKRWAHAIKRDVIALYWAARDPRVPWYAKLCAAAIAAYALSPIASSPLLGYLDEVILLPLAIMLATRMIPADIMAEHRAAAARDGPFGSRDRRIARVALACSGTASSAPLARSLRGPGHSLARCG